jgi:hypothetical protein
MNEAYLIIQMQEAVNKLTRLTRASRNVDYLEVRKICTQIENDAHALSQWAMNAEEAMDLVSWKLMRERHNRETT